MKLWFGLLFILLFQQSGLSAEEATTLVVSSITPTAPTSGEEIIEGPPQIYAMTLQSNITNRFVTTLVTSKMKNPSNTANEATFSVILPNQAFISQFIMEIEGKSYKAYVKSKEEAKEIYDKAVASGVGAGIVALNPRDTNTFTVSVNIEPKSKAVFRLTYEELLNRRDGFYELVLNIHPGQIIKDLNVEVNINESRPISYLTTPSIRSGNEISKENEGLKPSATTNIFHETNNTSAVVKFHPDKDEQIKFAESLGTRKEFGLAGQFVVRYDVERDPEGGEILVRDGYFVHFFAPTDLEPLPKHVVFVLDHSGSMMGTKLEQLVQAMQKILSELTEDDIFNIVRFTGEASVWDVTNNSFVTVKKGDREYGQLEPQLRELNLPREVPANEENINKAKEAIGTRSYMGSTNIIEGLEVGLFLITSAQELLEKKYQPLMVFLTDGLPNAGLSDNDRITDIITQLNSGEVRTSIFSLSFGNDANKKALQKLSARNLGFSRHIYEAADASLQLQQFYKEISSPLLNNVTFKYVDEVTEVTKTHHPIYFRGSELVVAGKTPTSAVSAGAWGWRQSGWVNLQPKVERPIGSLERLWAYLTVKQILEARETADNKTDLTKKALDIALKYSFVTAVSSLVVVKPNATAPLGPPRPLQYRPSFDSLPASSGPVGIPSPRPNQGWSQRSWTGWTARPGQGWSQPGQAYSHPGQGWYRPAEVEVTHQSISAGPHHSYVASSVVVENGLQNRGSGRPYWRHHSHHRTTSGRFSHGGHSSSSGFRRFDGTRHQNYPSSSSSRQNDEAAPLWLQEIQNSTGTITTPTGAFVLGRAGADLESPDCPRTPLDAPGKCKPVIECTSVFPKLSNLTVYLEYFCPLGTIAGVCCPSTLPISTTIQPN